MPVITTSNGKGRFTYKLYSVNELKRAWSTFGSLNKKDVEGDKRFVVCRADSEKEALILAALILRETEMAPSATYYDNINRRLCICCEYQTDTEDAVLGCHLVIREYMAMYKLDKLEFCWRGEPLFYRSEVDAKDFYKNRDPSHDTPNQDYGGIGNIHTRIPSEFAGII